MAIPNAKSATNSSFLYPYKDSQTKPGRKANSLCSWQYGKHEIKFSGRAARSEQRSREKYRLPENLGLLNAAHFYHLTDLN